MQTAYGNLRLEIQTSCKSPVGILRTSFRENGKLKHTQHGRITGCTLLQLKLLQRAFCEQVIPRDDPEAFKILHSREYGASYSILTIAKQLGLPQALYSRLEPWVNSLLAMIFGRLVYAGGEFDSRSIQSLSDGLFEKRAINTGLAFDPRQHRAHAVQTVADEGIGPIGVVDITGAMVNIKDLVSLPTVTKRWVVAARTLLFLVETHHRSFGVASCAKH